MSPLQATPQASRPTTGPQIIDAVRSMFSFLDGQSPLSEELGTLTPETVATFHAHGLFRIQAPLEVGGAEVDLTTALEVVEQTARADGSAGWTLMAGMTNMAIAGAYFGDEAVEQIFSDPEAVIAGQIAPRGVASATERGYEVAGDFGFASGSPHSTWFFGGFRVQQDGEFVRLPNGLPKVVAGVVPRSQTELLGNWDVIGLSATASVDYRIPPQLLPEPYSFEFFDARPLRGGPLYRVGANGLTCVAHAGFALGVARRALDDTVELAQTKRRPGRPTVIDDPVFQYRYANAEAALAGARHFAFSAMQELEQAAEADDVNNRVRASARLATTHACTTASGVIGMAYEFAGSAGLRKGSAIHRCYRDIAAGEQHVFTDHSTYRDAAVVYLDNAPESIWL